MQDASDSQGKADSAAPGPCFASELDPGLFAVSSSSREGLVVRLRDVPQFEAEAACVLLQWGARVKLGWGASLAWFPCSLSLRNNML